jgi:hypothetical protein
MPKKSLKKKTSLKNKRRSQNITVEEKYHYYSFGFLIGDY